MWRRNGGCNAFLGEDPDSSACPGSPQPMGMSVINKGWPGRRGKPSPCWLSREDASLGKTSYLNLICLDVKDRHNLHLVFSKWPINSIYVSTDGANPTNTLRGYLHTTKERAWVQGVAPSQHGEELGTCTAQSNEQRMRSQNYLMLIPALPVPAAVLLLSAGHLIFFHILLCTINILVPSVRFPF